MDEPAAGLNDAEAEELQGVVADIVAQGACGVLLIEHRMPLVFRLCHRIQVLQHGATIAVGTPDEIRAHNAVRTAYLGDEAVIAMLAIENLQVNYGSITALRGIDISVGAGEIVAVIGPNGAGKSTLLLTIAGVVRRKRAA